MFDVGERLSSYDPLWESWYKYSYIGEGASARVYEYRQNVYGIVSSSAVKVIPVIVRNGSAKEIESKRQIAAIEINNMSKLDGKPYLVHCRNHAFRTITDDNGAVVGFDLMIQMDLLKTLGDHLKDVGSMSEEDIIILAQQIGNALKSMHDIKMLHRDIKIDNIYINDIGEYLLGDFGVSKQLSDGASKSLAGTEPFIAPEVWNVPKTGESYSEPADIYSFGLNLYYLLNDNMLPFVEENFSENQIQDAIDKRLRGDTLPRPKKGSEDLITIIMKCCEYKQEDRYSSIEDVLADIKKMCVSRGYPINVRGSNVSKANALDKYKTMSADPLETGDVSQFTSRINKEHDSDIYDVEIQNDLKELEEYIRKHHQKLVSSKASKLIKKADAGDTYSQFVLQQNYNEGSKLWLYWNIRAALTGHPVSSYMLATYYESVGDDFEKAAFWYNKALEAGNKKAKDPLARLCRKIGDCYYIGNGVNQNYTKAVNWYEKSVEADCVEALNSLGVCYFYGFGTNQDYKKAVFLFEKATDAKDSAAQNNLGMCYYFGKGVNQDYNKAFYWYSKSAESGDADAKNNLGTCYFEGIGVTQDYAKAVHWYDEAAKAGCITAQNNLGICYDEGKGIERNSKEAVNCYSKSAVENSIAQYNLGVCYYTGNGIEKDYKKAAFWFEKSSENNICSQRNLGICYENGQGVDRNREKALYWYKKAADGGDKKALERFEYLSQHK